MRRFRAFHDPRHQWTLSGVSRVAHGGQIRTKAGILSRASTSLNRRDAHHHTTLYSTRRHRPKTRSTSSMEALPTFAYPSTPQSQTSYLRSSQHPDPEPDQATRSELQPAEQASQESLRSLGNGTVGTGRSLQTSSSNVSQLTPYTDLTSPSSLAPESYGQHSQYRPEVARIRTPETSLDPGRNDSYAIASPMSVTSPISTNGTKRTASGHVKNAPSLPNTPLPATFAGKRSRADSISSTGSRAGELAATLKARLGYAMAKVQHGWENKSLSEVEQLARHKHRHSMSQLDYHQRPSSSWAGMSNGRGVYESPRAREYGYAGDEHPSKRHSGTDYASFMPPSLPDFAAAPRLQPAADIRPTSQRRENHIYPSSQPLPQTNAMSPPRTPVNGFARKPPTIRTELQTAEAERDALQALFQLGSPHSSQVPWQQSSQASSSQASPLRGEFTTPRRVTFARSESDSSARRSSESSLHETREGVMQEA